jgi:hypothetical protein
MRIMILGLSTILMGACAGENGVGGQEEPRTWDGDFLLDQMIIDCNGVDEWTYDVWTQGWGDLVTVEVIARDPFLGSWLEYHQLPEVDYGEDWAHHQLVLDQAESEGEYADSTSTYIACEAKTFVTYVFATWRYDGEMQECVAWGLDPAGEAPQCANWGENGH